MTDYLTRLAAALDGAGTDPDTLARIAAGVSRWEPIETAPPEAVSSATKIIVARIGVDRPGHVSWVTSAWRCEKHDKWTTGDPIEGCCGLIPPTHWMLIGGAPDA